MKQADEKVAEAYTLGQRFAGMIREHQSEALLPWLEDATKSSIDALMGFAKGIRQDIAAVTNALSTPWSNGQVEGQVKSPRTRGSETHQTPDVWSRQFRSASEASACLANEVLMDDVHSGLTVSQIMTEAH